MRVKVRSNPLPPQKRPGQAALEELIQACIDDRTYLSERYVRDVRVVEERMQGYINRLDKLKGVTK